jgi:hypothetical protein
MPLYIFIVILHIQVYSPYSTTAFGLHVYTSNVSYVEFSIENSPISYTNLWFAYVFTYVYVYVRSIRLKNASKSVLIGCFRVFSQFISTENNFLHTMTSKLNPYRKFIMILTKNNFDQVSVQDLRPIILLIGMHLYTQCTAPSFRLSLGHLSIDLHAVFTV